MSGSKQNKEEVQDMVDKRIKQEQEKGSKKCAE